MRSRRPLLIISLLLFITISTAAQETEEISKVEVFGGYSLLRAESSNFNGWKAVVSANVNSWFAVAADFDGHYFSEMTPEGKLKKGEHSITFGPHFSLRNKSWVIPFAYTTAGVAWEKTKLGTESETEAGFAFEAGGGLDLELTKKVSLRLFDIGMSVTNIGGHTSTKPKFSTGLVFSFGN